MNEEKCTSNLILHREERWTPIPMEILHHPTMSADATGVILYIKSWTSGDQELINPEEIWENKNITTRS